jgi:hypothetical protein
MSLKNSNDTIGNRTRLEEAEGPEPPQPRERTVTVLRLAEGFVVRTMTGVESSK